MDGSSAAHRCPTAVGRPRPAVEPMSRRDYGPTAVAYGGPTAVVYGGPLSTYTNGSSAAHRQLTAVGRPRPAVEPMSRPDYVLECTCIATDNACKLVINLIFNTIIYRIYIKYGYL